MWFLNHSVINSWRPTYNADKISYLLRIPSFTLLLYIFLFIYLCSYIFSYLYYLCICRALDLISNALESHFSLLSIWPRKFPRFECLTKKMRYAQLVMGPAGSGKSTYCTALAAHAQVCLLMRTWQLSTHWCDFCQLVRTWQPSTHWCDFCQLVRSQHMTTQSLSRMPRGPSVLSTWTLLLSFSTTNPQQI